GSEQTRASTQTVVYVNLRPHRRRTPGIQQQVLDDARRPLDLGFHGLQAPSDLGGQRQILHEQLHVAGERGQRRADLVGNGGGELADGRESLSPRGRVLCCRKHFVRARQCIIF